MLSYPWNRQKFWVRHLIPSEPWFFFGGGTLFYFPGRGGRFQQVDAMRNKEFISNGLTNTSLSMTPTTHYQALSQDDTDYTLPIILSVWHQLLSTNPSHSMTPTTHYQSFSQYDTDYTLPILLSLTIQYQSFSQYDTEHTLPILLSVWHRLHIADPSLCMTPTTH